MSQRLLTHVEFRSDRFPPLEGEEEEINPGLWGKLLANFLREGLLLWGYEVPQPIPEDWGWVLRILNQPFRMWIGCGHYQEFDDGFLCFIHPHKQRIWRGLRRIQTSESIEKLQKAMDEILIESAGIRAKRWWTHDEFNHPGKNSTQHQN